MRLNHVKQVVSMLLPIGALVLLASCGNKSVSRAFGLERSLPDEYTIVTRAPLSMPPSEKLNLPGHDGVTDAQNPRMRALETLSLEEVLHPVTGSDSAGQESLVSEATNAARANQASELSGVGGLTDKLMFWRGKNITVVDGPAENARLRRASALGEKPSSGPTPAKELNSGL